MFLQPITRNSLVRVQHEKVIDEGSCARAHKIWNIILSFPNFYKCFFSRLGPKWLCACDQGEQNDPK